MPESIAIALIVLGAVLLLVAIVGGQFKIFAAEVSARVSKPARVIAFILGMVFLLAGIGYEQMGTQQQPQAVVDTSKPLNPNPVSHPAVDRSEALQYDPHVLDEQLTQQQEIDVWGLLGIDTNKYRPTAEDSLAAFFYLLRLAAEAEN